MFIQIIAVLLMLFGLVGTLFPKFHGAIIILWGTIGYILSAGLTEFSTRLLLGITGIAALAEISGKVLQSYLTKRYKVSPRFSTDTTVGNLAGIVVIEALFGLLGTVVFEAIIGKTLLPRINTVAAVFIRLFVGAAFRFSCGLVMIFLVLKYAAR